MTDPAAPPAPFEGAAEANVGDTVAWLEAQQDRTNAASALRAFEQARAGGPRKGVMAAIDASGDTPAPAPAPASGDGGVAEVTERVQGWRRQGYVGHKPRVESEDGTPNDAFTFPGGGR